jgi:hypothetical protein
MMQSQQQILEEVQAKKDEAAALFQRFQPRDALLLYRELADKCPTEAVFVSNISACCYALGDYGESSDAAERAIVMLCRSSKRDDKILRKNIVRLSICCVLDETLIAVQPEVLSLLQEVLASPAELKVWPTSDVDHLNFLVNQRKDKDGGGLDDFFASSSYRAILNKAVPIYRARPISTREFFSVGQDNAQSMLAGETMFETGPVAGERCVINVSDDRSELSLEKERVLLIAGFGDGRHAFATLIDMGRQLKRTQSESGGGSGGVDPLRVTLALNDVHPGSCAAFLVRLRAIQKLQQFSYVQVLRNEVPAVRAVSLVVYLFTELAMPARLAAEVDAILDELLLEGVDAFYSLRGPTTTTTTTAPFLLVDEQSWAQVRETLQLWRDGSGGLTAAGIMNTHHDIRTATHEPGPNTSKEFRAAVSKANDRIANRAEYKRAQEEVRRGIAKLSDQEIMGVIQDENGMSKTRDMVKYRTFVASVIDSKSKINQMYSRRELAFDNINSDTSIFMRCKFILPKPCLLAADDPPLAHLLEQLASRQPPGAAPPSRWQQHKAARTYGRLC